MSIITVGASSPRPEVDWWHRDGLNLVDTSGQIQKLHGVTGFSLQMDFHQGRFDKLMRFADGCHARGVHTVRYFTMFKAVPSVGRPTFSATDYAPEELGECIRFVRQQMGLRAWAVGFCDQHAGSPVLLTEAQQDAHWQALCAAEPDDIECVNEPGRNGGANGGYALSGRLPRPVGRSIAFRGCVDDGEDPRAAGSLWDTTTLHPPRGYAQGRKPGKVCYEDEVQGAPTWPATGIPARAGEPFQISAATARECADASALCDLMGGGFLIHDVWPWSLQNCFWPQDQRDKLDAVQASWSAGIPVDLVSANYDRDNIVTGPQMGGDFYRYYTMWRGNRGCCVVCYADPANAVANHGWRIVGRGGYDGNVLFLER